MNEAQNARKQVPFWQMFVEALDEFPIYFIQSKASTSHHEYSQKQPGEQIRHFAKQLLEHRGLGQSLARVTGTLALGLP